VRGLLSCHVRLANCESSLDADAVARAATATVDSYICVETHKDEQAFPWVLGTVVKASHLAEVGVSHTDTSNAPHLEAVKQGEPALSIRLWEALEPGSTSYVEGSTIVLVPARRVRVVDVQLESVRATPRLAAMPNALQRMTVSKESLQEIRAEMPSGDDSWEVRMPSPCTYKLPPLHADI
jgi:hypothetical protein